MNVQFRVNVSLDAPSEKRQRNIEIDMKTILTEVVDADQKYNNLSSDATKSKDNEKLSVFTHFSQESAFLTFFTNLLASHMIFSMQSSPSIAAKTRLVTTRKSSLLIDMRLGAASNKKVPSFLLLFTKTKLMECNLPCSAL